MLSIIIMLNHYYTIIINKMKMKICSVSPYDDELSKTMLYSDSPTMSHRYNGD